jgi:hypothetical protein
MNNLLDIVNSWAEKFAYRVMQMSGVPEKSLNNYLDAVKEKNRDKIKADEELKAKVPFLQNIFYLGLVLLVIYVYDRFFRDTRRR